MRIEQRTNRGGSQSFIVRIKIAGMRSPAKAFLVGDQYPTKKAAREAAARWGFEQERRLRDQKRAAAIPNIATLIVAQLIGAYLADDGTKALRSLEDRARALRFWQREIGTLRCFDEVTPPVIRAARDKLKRSGLSNASCNRTVAGMRKAWNWGRAAALVPTASVWPPETMLPEPRGRVRYLSEVELEILLKVAAPYPHVHAAIVVAIATGLREGELLRLQWGDVNLSADGAHVTVHESKTDQRRRVYLPPSAAAVLKGLRAGPVVSTGAIFLNALTGQPMNKDHIENRWRRHILPAARAAAPHLFRDLRWHDLRHTAASYLAQAGATLLEIATQLGHTNLGTTQRYAHLAEGKPLPAHAGLDARLRRGKGEPA